MPRAVAGGYRIPCDYLPETGNNSGMLGAPVIQRFGRWPTDRFAPQNDREICDERIFRTTIKL
jgi:hypothetical protein